MGNSIKVISISNSPTSSQPLLNSLKSRNWDVDLILTEWRGLGTKPIVLYEYLKSNNNIKNFIFVDAHDVICLGGPDEFESKIKNESRMLVSAERGCWPPPVAEQFEHLYKRNWHGFNYLNAGLFYSPSKLFIEMFERAAPKYDGEDQWWMHMHYLFGNSNIKLDTEQSVFNSHSFIREGDYTYENNRVQIMGNEPIFIHFNGRTVDEKFNELIKL